MSNQLTVNQTASILETLRGDLAPMLAENGQSFDRLRTVFMTAVQQNPDILKCSEISIQREIRKCAADGLVPDNKEAAMIPYKGELQYQPMVLGIIKRVKELGGVFSITCNLVFQNDEFILNEADPDSLVHKSDPFSKDRGPIVGGYAIFRDDEKRVMHLETMSMDDFERVRKASKAPDSPAWKNWLNEMCRKAVLRRGAKYISINNDKIRALLERQDEMFDFQNMRTVDRVNPFTGEVIDNNSAPAISHQQQMPMTQDREQERQPAQQRQEGRQQQNSRSNDQRGQRQDDRSSQGKPAGNKDAPKTETKAKDDKPPVFPADIDVFPADKEKAVEGVEKLLGIALLPDLDPPGRRGVLRDAAQHWKESTPATIHPLLKACIDMSDWAIQQQVKELAWAGEHAMFVNKAKMLLEVEKLNVGKYP